MRSRQERKDLNKARRLSDRVSEALTVRLSRLAREGKSLFLLTLMFGYVPEYKSNRESSLVRLGKRVEVLWYSVIDRLFERADLSESFGVGFFDLGPENGRNAGLHCHVLLALNEKRFKGKYREGFESFWSRESSKFVGRPRVVGRESRDVLVRSHLTRFDGSEHGIRYCAKSIGESGVGRLGFESVLYLGCPVRE